MTISLCRHEEVQCPFQGWTPRHPRLPGIPEVLGFLLIFLFYSVKGEMPCSSRVPQFPTQDSLSPAFQKSPTWGLATCKNMDLAWSGNRILVPKSPFKSRTVLDGFQDESPKKLDPME